MFRRFSLSTAALIAFGVSHADAALTISKKPTANVSCSGDVCTATARKATLNATDLATMLASSDIIVTSGRKAQDIEVAGALAWASTHRLTLDSFRTTTVGGSVQVTGTGAMTIITNDGGSGGALSFAGKGHIEFLDTNSNLVISGIPYTLVADLATLGQAVGAHQSGNFALARTYDASADGVYTTDPVSTILLGRLEGLGNAFENIKIDVPTAGNHVGLFYGFVGGSVSDLRLVHESVRGGANSGIGGLAGVCQGATVNVDMSGNVAGGADSQIGGLCGILDGTLSNSHVSGAVKGTGTDTGVQSFIGGIAGEGGAIVNSSAASKIIAGKGWHAGGLVGESDAAIQSSFATGSVVTGDNTFAGGLAGNHTSGGISNSYATGFVSGAVGSTVGGLVGGNDAPVSDSYSTGGVASGSGNAVGGFIGNDAGASDLTDTYFDLTTSGQSHGVGNNTAYPGITGLTTEEFQAGLPSGFDPSVWAESPDINGGLPYLLAQPPG